MNRRVHLELRRVRAEYPLLVLAVAIAIVLLIPQFASAHEVRPAYLSIQEEAPNEFSVYVLKS